MSAPSALASGPSLGGGVREQPGPAGAALERQAPCAACAQASGNPAEEYKSVCEFLRLQATLRFYRLALLLGTTGSIVTALTSSAVRFHFARPEMLRFGGLAVSAAFLVMELRATSQWVLLRLRCNALARAMGFQALPESSRWNPLSTSGAGFYLHAAIVALWGASLLLRWDAGL